ncbi:hypothetical protein O181_022394 [Austropuccinia psidii MF-1]|uniref:MULE transposase domain-containing protein n=1 Tax=Austropuccinia psidii MF-1 TaxID=1389203 RepID=A0A9Q3GXM4_9BASI|nr:hypothetical protein [Austropuccinia psidii MF-1]
MLQPPTEGEFQTLELLWQHVHNVARDQGYAVSTLRSNMTHNQIEIGCDRSGTPNANKNPSKTVTSRKLDCPFRLYSRKYAKSTTWTLEVKNPEHSHNSTENIMGHPAFRKCNKKETSQNSQMSESLLMPRQIQAQLCSHRESERPVILQEIYNQVKKISKDKLQGRRPIDTLIDNLKKENIVWSSARDSEGHITSLFFTHPLSIKLLHGFPHVILMDCTYKTNKYKIPLIHIVGFSSTNKTFYGAFCFMKNETETSYTWALNQYIEKILNNTNIFPPSVLVLYKDLALKKSLKKLIPDSKVMLCIWHIKKDVRYSSTEKSFKDNWKKLQKQVKNPEVLQYLENTWLPLKEYYVPDWTNHHCHLGVGSTSRVEGAHAMVKIWLQKYTGTLLEVVRALHMAFRNQFIEIINRISKEMIVHVKIFPPQIYALNGKVCHYALQMAFENFKTKFPPNRKCTRQYKNHQEIPCKHETQKAFFRIQRLEISDFHPQWHLNLPTCFQGDDQSVEKERKNEAKNILEDIGEEIFQIQMAEITPVLQHSQDVLTGKVPFNQIPKGQENDKYYEEPPECKNIRGRP